MLKEALSSVDAQIVPALEVLVMDKGKDGWVKMNEGVRIAKGDCFIILSDDDKLDPEYIAKTTALMEKTGVDIVATPLENFGDETGVHGVGAFPFFTALCKKSIWEKVGGWDDVGAASDADFWFKCFDAGGHWEILGEPLFKYRKHGGQASNAITQEEWDYTNNLVKERHGHN